MKKPFHEFRKRIHISLHWEMRHVTEAIVIHMKRLLFFFFTFFLVSILLCGFAREWQVLRVVRHISNFPCDGNGFLIVSLLFYNSPGEAHNTMNYHE